MRRREFFAWLASAVASASVRPALAMTRQVRRIAALMVGEAGEPRDHALIQSMQLALEGLGWVVGNNLLIDVLWAGGSVERMHKNAADLVASKPEVIIAQGTTNLSAIAQATQAVPIIFVEVTDPISTGFVKSFSQPGGNVTGFTNLEPSIVGKWIGLLKEIAPQVNRIGMVFDPNITPGGGSVYTIPLQEFAQTFGVEPVKIPYHDAAEFDHLMTAFANEGRSGLIAATGTFVRRGAILANASRLRLPNVFPYREFALEGGLISYGVDISDLYRRAASYVDRILRGEKPPSLPIQNPVKFELLINMKSAKALGLDVPPTLLARADEVIE